MSTSGFTPPSAIPLSEGKEKDELGQLRGMIQGQLAQQIVQSPKILETFFKKQVEQGKKAEKAKQQEAVEKEEAETYERKLAYEGRPDLGGERAAPFGPIENRYFKALGRTKPVTPEEAAKGITWEEKNAHAQAEIAKEKHDKELAKLRKKYPRDHKFYFEQDLPRTVRKQEEKRFKDKHPDYHKARTRMEGMRKKADEYVKARKAGKPIQEEKPTMWEIFKGLFTGTLR